MNHMCRSFATIFPVSHAIDKIFVGFLHCLECRHKIISMSFGQSLQYSLILDTRSIVSSPVDVYASIKAAISFLPGIISDPEALHVPTLLCSTHLKTQRL